MNPVRIASALIAIALTSATAQAAVLEWDFSLDAWFDDATFAPVRGSGGTGTPVEERYDLSWGGSAARSALAIRAQDGTFEDEGAPAEGSLETDGGFVSANRFFHDNRVVPLRSLILDDATLRFDLALSPTGSSGRPTSIDIAPFLVNFRETPNRGACESGVGQCADIFAISSDAPFANGAFTQDFLFDGQRYFVDLTAEGLDRLTDQQCDAAAAGEDCVGFVTPENMLNMTQLALRIRSEVPEPAALGLLGLGLLGLTGVRRRRSE